MVGYIDNFFYLAVADASQGQPSLLAQIMAMMPMLIFMVVVIYFFILRPQQKKQKEHQLLLESLKKGDRVITIGGIYGTYIGEGKDKSIAVIKISENTKIEINKNAIANVVKK